MHNKYMILRAFLVMALTSCLCIFETYAASVDLRLNINFKTNEALIDKDGQAVLKKLFMTLKKYPETKILISGHTDNVGTEDFNQALSLRRAESVEANLFGKGLDRSRMVIKGFGETAPIGTNDTPEGRYKNRRVVASVLGLTDEEEEVLVADSPKEIIKESPKVESFKRTIKVKRRINRKFYVTGFLGPHWSSVFYGNSIVYEHTALTPLSFGVDVGYKISKNWFADAYLYYLPTEADEGDSGIDFGGLRLTKVTYENNLYGMRIGRYLKKTNRYRFSVIGGLSSHILGGIKRTSPTDFTFSKFQHLGLTMGIRHEQKITGTWVFDSDLAYLIPLSVENAASASGRLWYRGILGVKKRLNKRWRLGIEYQVVYHETDFTFAPGIATRPEFLIQTLMFGLKYNF